MPRDLIEREAAKEPIRLEIQRQLDFIKEHEGDKETQDMHRYGTYLLREIASALDALPSASAAEGAKGKPTMLFAQIKLTNDWHWWRRRSGAWESMCEFPFQESTWFSGGLSVDRTASDAEALRMYDEDMK